MSDALIFGGFFVGLFVVRIVVATVVFFLVIPEGDRCPHCDAATLRVHQPRLARILPFVRVSWCYFMLPESDACPMCDQPTLRVKSPAWNVLMPWFRTSWCYECGWEGWLRCGALPASPVSSTRVGSTSSRR